MDIHYLIAALFYLLLLVLAYEIIVFTNLKEEESEKIISKAFNYAYSILIFGLLIVYALLILPHITLDYETTTYLILASKFVSVCTLGVSLFILYRKIALKD